MEWFRNRIDAKIVIKQFRRQFNEVRPHSSLGQLTPVEFKQKLLASNLIAGATSANLPANIGLDNVSIRVLTF